MRLLTLRTALYQAGMTKMKYEGENIVMYMPQSKSFRLETLLYLRKTTGIPLEQNGRRLIIHGILKSPEWVAHLEKLLKLLWE
jgi:hypothetical protein